MKDIKASGGLTEVIKSTFYLGYLIKEYGNGSCKVIAPDGSSFGTFASLGAAKDAISKLVPRDHDAATNEEDSLGMK